MIANDIRIACHRTLAKGQYEPLSDGTTFCNYALHDILTDLGLPKFCVSESGDRRLMANEIIEKMERMGLSKVDASDAHRLSNEGVIVVAGMRMPQHGHVAVVYPFPAMYFSGKWNRSVPCVANIGKDNGVMPCNYSFGALPKFYKVL